MFIMVKNVLLLIAVVASFIVVDALNDASSSSKRVTVIHGKDHYMGFINNGGKLQVSLSNDNGSTWSAWLAVNTSTSYPTLVSNPVSIVNKYSNTVTVYTQASNGQVYSFSEASESSFTVKQLSTNIPLTLTVSQCSTDGIKIMNYRDMTHLFVRSQSNESRIYYSYQYWTKGVWSKFVTIADDKNHLKYDFDIVENSFVKRIEVFAVVGDNKVKHTWQSSPTSFDDSWHEVVVIDSPKFNSAPVAHAMGKNDFNGMVEVFVRDGNTLRNIHQTTCDKVNNPWGPCTWEVSWHKLGGDLPSDPNIPNPFTVSNNIHKGQEIFVIGAKDGALYHIWQPEKGTSWSDWDLLGIFSSGDKFMSLPFIAMDSHDWWQAFGESSTGGLHRFVQGDLIFTAMPQKQSYSLNFTVNWQVPTDQATSKDWIGVYPRNADNSKYVNFIYVGGGQNPKVDPVHKGTLQLIAVLPNGLYDVRYLVNKEYDNVTSVPVEVINAPILPDWVAVYQGIARGLGNLSTNLTSCVKDGNSTIVTFEKAFKAFEDREIVTGLHLFAEALQDVVDTLIQCEETTVAEKIKKFIEDLVSCTESKCDKFVIDIAIEIVILYERFYEIYGDILAAKNSFDIKAYEMGGLCVGRVTWACLAAPDNFK